MNLSSKIKIKYLVHNVFDKYLLFWQRDLIIYRKV